MATYEEIRRLADQYISGLGQVVTQSVSDDNSEPDIPKRGTCDFCGKKKGDLKNGVYICGSSKCQKKFNKLPKPSMLYAANGLSTGVSASTYGISDFNDGINTIISDGGVPIEDLQGPQW